MRLLSLSVLLPPIAAARLLHSIPEDAHAFPKFRVSFLKALPLARDTAHHWITHGLRGGQLEFLDQPWTDDSPREIEGVSSPDSAPSIVSNYTLEYMRMGPQDSYLCLIPKPPDHVPSFSEKDAPEPEVTPSRSWSLLQPLSGTCLYHRQGWFTYSYCHNDQIRQFKEASQAPNPAGGHRPPEEDPEWEAYTLGKAPKPGADLTIAEQTDGRPVNIELAHGAGSRYLVQKWGDGTMCDKTGKSREVEVQFHCSMTMTDTVLFVKETKTCSYVLVIHTPRLCGEPGFKSLRDKGEESLIQCRGVVDMPPTTNGAGQQSNIPDADHPVQRFRKRPILPAPAKGPGVKKKGQDAAYGNLLRKTIETIIEAQDLKQPNHVLEGVSNDENGLMFEFVDGGEITEDTVNKLADILSAAGIDVKAEKIVIGGEKENEQSVKKKQPHKGVPVRDEF